jgi:hypothetical protein
MSMLMLAFFGQKKAYVPTSYTKTFTGNTTFIMPAGVSILDSVSGHGAPGSPATPGTTEQYTHVVTSYYRRTGGIDYVESDVDGWIGTNAATGSDYCDPAVAYCDPNTDALCVTGSTVYWQSVKCYYYKTRTVGGTSATTGASASGFGKVFPGGVGGPASTVTYDNVAVTALASYPVVVPSGALITITYKV